MKLADKIDCVDAEDEDGTFEDIEIDGEPETVLDIDQLKMQSLRLLNLDLLIELTTPIPHLSAFARVAEDAFDELQETAFAILTSLLFSKLPQVKQSLQPYLLRMAGAVETYIRVASYKCDKPSAENACECLLKLCDAEPVQLFVFDSLVSVIAEYGIYMNTTDSMAKIYLVQTLQQVLPKQRMTDDHQILLVT